MAALAHWDKPVTAGTGDLTGPPAAAPKAVRLPTALSGMRAVLHFPI
jgi:hypothetical protein